MPRPPMPSLITDCESAVDYRRKFHEMYFGKVITDIMGRSVSIGTDAFDHFCYKEPDGGKPSIANRTVWQEERAKRMGWISLAIEHPWKILVERDEQNNKQKHKSSRKQDYIYISEYEGKNPDVVERFAVVVKKTSNGFLFITAYMPDYYRIKKWYSTCTKEYP